jgi:hypothetical protein
LRRGTPNFLGQVPPSHSETVKDLVITDPSFDIEEGSCLFMNKTKNLSRKYIVKVGHDLICYKSQVHQHPIVFQHSLRGVFVSTSEVQVSSVTYYTLTVRLSMDLQRTLYFEIKEERDRWHHSLEIVNNP